MIRNLTLWTALTLFIIPTLQGQTLHYVRQSASGGAQNGSNWTDAFVDLQQALTAAQAGDIIWVAAGTYKPTSTTNRHKSFQLVSGVKMYGGFRGTETSLEQQSIPSGTPAYYSVHLRDVSTGVYQVMLETDSGVWSGKWVKI